MLLTIGVVRPRVTGATLMCVREPEDVCTEDRYTELRSWSRHNNYKTPKSMKSVWTTSYQKSYDAKKIGFHPDRYILDYFNGNTRVMATRRSHESDRLKSTFNDRAREGFRYWMVDRPRPSHFGKYGTGSYKTVLGIGNAPRT